MVVGGSLSDGLLVNLDPRLSIERLAVGRYVVIEGTSGSRFFGLVTDIALDATNPDLVRQPPPAGDAFAAEVYSRRAGLRRPEGHARCSCSIRSDDEPRPVKTVPAHFTAVYEATARRRRAASSAPRTRSTSTSAPRSTWRHVHVNLDLERLVERSSGVFGKSGTGKSFITRTLLAGRHPLPAGLGPDLRHAQRLRLDRHGRGRARVQGPAPALPRRHRSASSPSTRRRSAARGSKVDRVLKIGYDQIEPEDVEMLAGLLDLSDVQVGALLLAAAASGQVAGSPSCWRTSRTTSWTTMLEDERIVKGTLHAIQRKFELFRRLDFLAPGRTRKTSSKTSSSA